MKEVEGGGWLLFTLLLVLRVKGGVLLHLLLRLFIYLSFFLCRGGSVVVDGGEAELMVLVFGCGEEEMRLCEVLDIVYVVVKFQIAALSLSLG